MTQVPPAPVAPVAPFAQPRSKGLAVAALVLGICAIIPALGMLTGLAAIILGIIVLATGRAGKGMAIAGLILGVALPVVSCPMIVLPALGRAQELARRTMCGTNLKTIGTNLALYLADYGDKVPPDVDTLIRLQGVSADVLECPSADTSRSPSIFVLFPASADVPSRSLVACDYRGSHGNDGRNVLLFTGTVAFMKEPDFQAELAKPENAAFAAALRAKEGP